MKPCKLIAEGYIDPICEFEYKHIMNYQQAYPLVHYHDYFEFFLVTDGTIIHNVNGSTIPLCAGNMVFIRPSDTHSFTYSGSECQFINIATMERTILDLFHYLGKGFDQEKLLKPALPPTLLLSSREVNEVIARFEVLHTLPVNDKLTLNLHLRFILINLFSRYFANKQKEDSGVPDWLNKVLIKLRKPENFKIGMPFVRDVACKSDEHISRSFKKYLNQTPTQHINELKLNYAANQIRFSNKRIIDIAFETGFENQSNFHRQFKQKFRCTPSEFRKLNKKDIKYDL